jgi:hypothetical protein
VPGLVIHLHDDELCKEVTEVINYYIFEVKATKKRVDVATILKGRKKLPMSELVVSAPRLRNPNIGDDIQYPAKKPGSSPKKIEPLAKPKDASSIDRSNIIDGPRRSRRLIR